MMSEDSSSGTRKQEALLLLDDNTATAIELLSELTHETPTDPQVWHYLGVAYAKHGQLQEAKQALYEAIEQGSPSAFTHYNLGIVLTDTGEFTLALDCYREAINLKPDLAEAHNNLGLVYMKLDRHEDAILAYKQAIQIKPEYTGALNNLGAARAKLGQHELAISHYKQALALDSELSDAHLNLGIAYVELGRHDEALMIYRHALELTPDNTEVYNNLALLFYDQGRISEAIAQLQIARTINLCDNLTSSNYLFMCNYYPSIKPEELFQEYIAWGEAICHAVTKRPIGGQSRYEEQRLRIGYVSPDFRTHSVAYFIEAILANHDPASVEAFCYANVVRPDAMTERLKQRSHHWHNIRGKTDDDVAALIRADAIDILIDLAGHTENNRLPVFARKPAPVQVTYLGYPNTTGLRTIDYRLTDIEADPPGQEPYHTEQLVRLPHGFLCYTSPPDAPAVTALPTSTVGHVTFGSFNNLAKMTPEVIGLWAQILKAIPGSRLVIKNKSMKDGPTRERYLALFRETGITEDRLDFVAWIPEAADHLGAYAHVDIALDTFPYNGTTTTCEALWMGVPVITLAGERHAARVGVSLLTRVGLTELIAQSPEEYVKLAVELAADTERLVQLRAGMRERMKHSPLCDAKSFTRDLETAYRGMWREWCEAATAFTAHQ